MMQISSCTQRNVIDSICFIHRDFLMTMKYKQQLGSSVISNPVNDISSLLLMSTIILDISSNSNEKSVEQSQDEVHKDAIGNDYINIKL